MKSSAGVAEIIKYGMLGDAEFFAYLEENMAALCALDADVVATVVARCCEMKKEIVREDERESGVRAKLNLGHTFGHAIEKLTGYGTWLHGEAVAVGTVLAAVTAEKQGKINCGDVKRIQDLIHRAGLPVRIAGIKCSKAIEGDRKVIKSSNQRRSPLYSAGRDRNNGDRRGSRRLIKEAFWKKDMSHDYGRF